MKKLDVLRRILDTGYLHEDENCSRDHDLEAIQWALNVIQAVEGLDHQYPNWVQLDDLLYEGYK